MTSDFNESQFNVPQEKSTSAFSLILIGSGVVALLTLVCCGGLGFWAYRSFSADLPAAREAADNFLNDLQTGRVDAAYAKTTASFQKAQSIENFRQFLDKSPALKVHSSRSLSSFHLSTSTFGKHANIKMSLNEKGNQTSVTLMLVEESGQWKVQQLNVP